jgi:NADPH2:quinone reductase
VSRAVEIAAHGGGEVLRLIDRDIPAPGPGEIVVENAAIGLNFIDVYQRKGLYPVSLPAILGTEGAGLVRVVGEGVERFQPGDRVVYFSGGGAYAEHARIPAGLAAPTPEALGDDIAASAFLKGLTALMLVEDVFHLKRGHRALVYAAVGGVGTFLTQWAAHIGAEVIAVVGDADKAARARGLGAAAVIIRTETKDIAAAARALTGGAGVDVVYDSVGAETFTASLDALAPRGMMVSYGNASGPVPPVAPLELGRRGSLSLCRPSLFHYATPERLPAMAARLFEMLATGAIKAPNPMAFPLAEVAAAHRLLESGRSTGPIILTP